MDARRTMLVVAALVFAVLGATMTFVYVKGIERRAFGGATLVEVFAVARDVPKGLPGEAAIDEGYIVPQRVPAKFRPATALTSLDSLRGRVALADLSVNTVVVEGQFVDPRTAQVTFSQRIPSGHVAVTIAVDQVRGVAGLLVPGDRVNILVNDGQEQRVLYQNVHILAIGRTAAPEPGETEAVETPGGGLITFSVPPAAASRIAFASQSGELYLTLVPPDHQPTDVPAVGSDSLFPAELTP